MPAPPPESLPAMVSAVRTRSFCCKIGASRRIPCRCNPDPCRAGRSLPRQSAMVRVAVQFASMNAATTTWFTGLPGAPNHGRSAAPSHVASVLFVAALTAAAAQISVPLPFTAVPFTFQPMVVLLGGLALGSKLGLASQVLYLAAGIAGLPVFAASLTLPPGPLRLLGPTGGYLHGVSRRRVRGGIPRRAWVQPALRDVGPARCWPVSPSSTRAGRRGSASSRGSERRTRPSASRRRS